VRIAFVAPLVTPIAEPQRGGSQAMVADLARGLVERGHDLTVFAAHGSRIPGVDVRHVVEAETLQETLFRDGRPAPPSQAAEAAFHRVANAVAAGRFDVVHNHAFDVPAVRSLAALAEPVVHTVHLPPTREMAGALRDALRRGERPPAVVTVSRTQGEAWRSAGVPNTPVPNGVPTERIPWSQRPGTGALFAGRFTPEKGVLDAIQIAERAGMKLSLAGWPYDPAFADREVYPRAAQSDAVVLGSLDRAQLWRRMAGAAVVLCPSRWDEPFGLVAAEAQAAGTAVVAYRRGAYAEVVVDGETGFLVDEGDVESAAVAVREALLLSRSACRRHAVSRLDIGDTIGRLERVYGVVAGRVGAGHE
jgi:glycosyltransferase involved in cell wall biosynthesis